MVHTSFRHLAFFPSVVLWTALGAFAESMAVPDDYPLMEMTPTIAQSIQLNWDLNLSKSDRIFQKWQDGQGLKQEIMPLSLPFEQIGTLAEGDGVLADGNLVDIYSIPVQANQIISITLTSDAFDSMLILMDGNLDLVAANDDSNGSSNSELTVQLPQTGEYYLGVRAYGPESRGAYQIKARIATENDLIRFEKQTEADQLYGEGIRLWSITEWQEALNLLEQALLLYREVGNRKGEGRTLIGIGKIVDDFGQFPQALDYYQQALEISREIGDRAGEGTILNNIGATYDKLGDYPQSLDHYQQALGIFHDIGDRVNEAYSFNNIGLSFFRLGNYFQALDHYQQALDIIYEAEDQAIEGTILNNIAGAYDRLGDYPQALDYSQQALQVNRERGARFEESISLNNLGLINHNLSDYPQALEYYKQALQIVSDIGNLQGEGQLLNNIGFIYSDLSNYFQALEYYQKSLSIRQEIGDREGQGQTLNNIGRTYFQLGNNYQALNHYQQALEIRQAIGDRAGEGITLNNIGLYYSKLGDYPKSLEYYQQSLEISQEISDQLGAATTLNNIGFTYHLLKDYSQSLDNFQQSLGIGREISNRFMEGTTLNNVGMTYYSLGDYPQALNYYQQALAISRTIGNRAGEATNLNNLGFIFSLTEQFSEAESHLFQAIQILDSLRDTDLTPSDRIALFDIQRTTYKAFQDTLISQKKIEKALEISEQGRARVLADQLIETIRNSNSSTEFFSTDVPDIPQIRRISQQQNATLVSYSINLSDALSIWIISPNGDINFEQVPLTDDGSIDFATIATLIQPDDPFYGGRSQSNTPTETLVADTRSALSVGRGIELIPIDPAETSDRLQQLHQLLINPIQEYLPTDPTEKVIFIPQDGLFTVPFPALQDENGTYLIQKHTILTAPSIQVLGLTPKLKQVQSGPSGTPLIVGNPTMPVDPSSQTDPKEHFRPLPNAETEAITIAKLFNTQPFTGSQATEATIKQRITQAPLIHFATHGLLEYGNPQDSGVLDVPGAIALAPGNGEDGLLTSAELLEMDLNADLVVLSACDTGRGRVTGDGVIGLSRSLITAGVPSIVVSLWSVPDAPTASLMTEFYGNMQQGMDKAQALRQAMLTMIEGDRHPRGWAAFTLIGESD